MGTYNAALQAFLSDIPLLILLGAVLFIIVLLMRGRRARNVEKIRSFSNADENGVPKKAVVKYFTGYQLQTAEMFQNDATEMSRQGYKPVSQCWLPGSYDGGLFILALILCIVGIGVLVLVYMLVTRPRGVLIVSYELRQPASDSVPLVAS